MAKITFNSQRCTGCRACEGACKQENNLPVGVRFRVVSSKLSGEYPKLKKTYNSKACKQCIKPKCLENCSINAISKDLETGIVNIDETVCNGCMTCIAACPFEAIKFDKAKKKACKCNYCLERIQKGLIPSCVNTCMTMALQWEN